MYLDSQINAVATLGITQENLVLLTRQYRHPVRQTILDLPAGKLNPGEDELAGARREFEEETGYAPGEIFKLGRYNQFPGMLHAFTHLFFTRQLIKIKYISLVNLIMDREEVTELIQAELNRKRLIEELRKITVDKVNRQKMLDDFKLLQQQLGGPGASERAARLILDGVKA